MDLSAARRRLSRSAGRRPPGPERGRPRREGPVGAGSGALSGAEGEGSQATSPTSAVQAGVACLALMWLVQVVTPLFARGERQVPTTAVVVLLAAASACAAAASAGWRRAGVAVVAATAVGLAVEVTGTRTGLPFGEYDYTGALEPQVLGVPLVVALAWAGMGLPAWAVAGRLVRSPVARVAVGAVALTGWDLFLDPQMVAEGYWTWPGGGAYRGIPLSNFAGWLLVSGLLMGIFAAVVPGARSTLAAATYLLMAVMEVLGFLLFFGDAVVALAGGLVCVPLGVAAVAGPARFGRRTGIGWRPLAARR